MSGGSSARARTPSFLIVCACALSAESLGAKSGLGSLDIAKFWLPLGSVARDSTECRYIAK